MFGVYIKDIYGNIELTDEVCYTYDNAFHIAFEENFNLLIEEGIENPDDEIVNEITNDLNLIYFYHVYEYNMNDLNLILNLIKKGLTS